VNSAKIRNNLLSSTRPVSETERDLWIAVIFQAMRDASMLHELERRHKRRSNSNQKHLYHLERDLQAARQAMAWLTKPSADLTEVCLMAGIEVSSILAKREEFLAGEFEFMKLQVATT